MRWGEVRWGEVRWGEVRWGEVRWGEVRWGQERWGGDRRGGSNNNHSPPTIKWVVYNWTSARDGEGWHQWGPDLIFEPGLYVCMYVWGREERNEKGVRKERGTRGGREREQFTHMFIVLWKGEELCEIGHPSHHPTHKHEKKGHMVHDKVTELGSDSIRAIAIAENQSTTSAHKRRQTAKRLGK